MALIAGGWLESNDFQTVASFYRQTGHRIVQVGREAFEKVRRGKHHTWSTRFQTLAASTVYDVSNSQKASCAALVFFIRVSKSTVKKKPRPIIIIATGGSASIKRQRRMHFKRFPIFRLCLFIHKRLPFSLSIYLVFYSTDYTTFPPISTAVSPLEGFSTPLSPPSNLPGTLLFKGNSSS